VLTGADARAGPVLHNKKNAVKIIISGVFLRMTRMIPPSMDTHNLLLRTPRMEDAGPIFERYAQDPEVSRYLIWRPHENLETTKQFLTRCLDVWQTGSAFPWVLVEKKSNILIGMIEACIHDCRLELGYVLARPYWNQGYATEAVRAVHDWAIAQPTIYRVWAVCDFENLASARVLEKVGMQKEGLLRRWMVHPNISNEPRDCWCYSKTK